MDLHKNLSGHFPSIDTSQTQCLYLILVLQNTIKKKKTKNDRKLLLKWSDDYKNELIIGLPHASIKTLKNIVSPCHIVATSKERLCPTRNICNKNKGEDTKYHYKLIFVK